MESCDQYVDVGRLDLYRQTLAGMLSWAAKYRMSKSHRPPEKQLPPPPRRTSASPGTASTPMCATRTPASVADGQPAWHQHRSHVSTAHHADRRRKSGVVGLS